MQHAIIRSALIQTGALLLATVPVSSVYADQAELPAVVASVAPAARAAQTVAAAAEPPVAPVVSAAVASPVLTEAASLRPGEFVWRPELASQGAVEVVVSIPLQRAFVYRGETLIGVTTVSTGRPGHGTPTGRFTITQKHRQHYSNLYNNAPMPFMQRLTNDGIALHAGQIPGHPASHGCVRLPLDFARHLFGATTVGAEVHITNDSLSPTEALAMVRGPGAYAGMGGPIEEAAN